MRLLSPEPGELRTQWPPFPPQGAWSLVKRLWQHHGGMPGEEGNYGYYGKD